MERDTQELPMLYAYDRDGFLCFVDDVPNGLACGCVCPACAQPLIARNGGSKLIHHFAHKAGSCAWSVESVLASLAARTLNESKVVALPTLSYADEVTGTAKQLTPARLMRLEEATLTEVAQRGAPDLLVRISAGAATRTFALCLSLVHTLTDAQADRLAAVSSGVVLVDLKRDLRRRKRLESRHFDRIEIIRGYQDPAFLQGLLTDTEAEDVLWVRNERADEAHAKSVEEAERREREREARRRKEEQRWREREAKRREEERRRERERRELAEARRADAARHKPEDEAWKTVSPEEMAKLDQMEAALWERRGRKRPTADEEARREREEAERAERERVEREARAREEKERAEELERQRAEIRRRREARRGRHSAYDVTTWRQVRDLKKGWLAQRGQLKAHVYHLDGHLSITISCALNAAALTEVCENLEELRKGASTFRVRLSAAQGTLFGDGTMDEEGRMWFAPASDGATVLRCLETLSDAGVFVRIDASGREFDLAQVDVEGRRMLLACVS